MKCILKHIIDGNVEGMGRRRKQLLDELKERKGYCTLKEEELDRTVRRTGF